MARSPALSHVAIGTGIYTLPRGFLRTERVNCLRQSRAGRLRRALCPPRFSGYRGMTPIALRPPEVAARIVPGRWEADLLKSASKGSAVGAPIERNRRFLRPTGLPGAGTATVLDDSTRRRRTLQPCLRRTLSDDQGPEMALYSLPATRRCIDVHFCGLHSPWRPGIYTNANGLVRTCLPKDSNLGATSDAERRRLERLFDNRARVILDFHTPIEVLPGLRHAVIAGVARQA